MKKWQAVEVVWEDAHGGGTNWVSPESLEHTPSRVRSVGQVVKSGKHGVTLALSYDMSSHSLDAYVFIPTACIVTIVALSANPE